MESRTKIFEPHVFKDKYKAQAYIMSATNGTSLISRIHKVKRLVDNAVIEKGNIIVYNEQRYRITRFFEMEDDLGVECKSIINKRLFVEIPLSEINVEMTIC